MDMKRTDTDINQRFWEIIDVSYKFNEYAELIKRCNKMIAYFEDDGA